jgi:hypothetical protein
MRKELIHLLFLGGPLLLLSCEKEKEQDPIPVTTSPVTNTDPGKLRISAQFQNGMTPGTRIGLATSAALASAHQYLQQHLVDSTLVVEFDSLPAGTYYADLQIPLRNNSYYTPAQPVQVTASLTTHSTLTVKIPAEVLLMHTDWRLTGYESESAGQVTDLYSSVSYCDKDDWLHFGPDSAAYFDEGPLKCAPEFPQQTHLTYAVLADGSELQLSGVSCQIESLTPTLLRYTFPYQGTLHRYTYQPY